MTRIDFLKRMFQVMLASILGLIAFILSRRSVSVNDCSSCPGNGICSGESDCSKYLAEKR